MNRSSGHRRTPARVRFLWLAALCGAYFVAETMAGVRIGSLTLFFDGLDFFERAATFALLAFTSWWSMTRRYALLAVIVIPAMIALTAAILPWWPRYSDISAVSTLMWMTLAVGSLTINAVNLAMLRTYRKRRIMSGGRFGYVIVRADFWSSLATLGAGLLVLVVRDRWPDVVGAVLALAVHLSSMTQLVSEHRSPKSHGK